MVTTHQTEIFTFWPVSADEPDAAGTEGVVAGLNADAPLEREAGSTPRPVPIPASPRFAEASFAPDALADPVCELSTAVALDSEVAGSNTADCTGNPETYC
jgi:hypothetical protein